MKSLYLSSIAVIGLAGMPATPITYTAPIETAQAIEVEVAETIMAEVSAYTSDPAETDDTPDITASGSKTKEGTLACPSRYEFGQKIEIEGKTYTCEDRMHSRYRDRNNFDIWMESKAEALTWGRRKLEVTIIQTHESKQSVPDRKGDESN